MQTKKKKTRKMRGYLQLLMCGVLLSTTVLPMTTVFAETMTPTTGSSTPVPTLDSSGTDLTTDESKAPESQAPTVPITDSTTEDTTESTQETPVEEHEMDNSEATPLEAVQPPQDTQRVPELRSNSNGIWGTSPISIDSDGNLIVGAGTLASNALTVDESSYIGDSSIKRGDVKTVTFSGKVMAPEDSKALFKSLTNCVSFTNMFNFDTQNVQDMNSMFSNDTSLKSIDLSNFRTQSVGTGTDSTGSMAWMFYKCTALRSLDVSSFDTSNVYSTLAMFAVSGIEALDLSNFNTSKVVAMNNMFNGMPNLEVLDISNFDTSHLDWSGDPISYMFSKSPKLKVLKLSKKIATFKGADGFALLSEITPSDIYTGKWQNVGEGTENNPKGSNIWTSTELLDKYNGATDADTYVWQKNKAKDLTVFYQDTDGNDISKSKTVSGNV
ncbi:BspA family leucine-rich repeat surface protein, partial [Enterococcus faecalis]|nr:BspA family leucine-rich repeat surface protein [Enterococcus faecalis]